MNPLFPEQFKKRDIPPLSPPITEEEQRWWATERVKVYQRVLLGVGLPFLIVFTVGAAIVRPEKLPFLLPRFILLAGLATLVQGRLAEGGMRKIEIRWKRIRESLLADSADEKSP